MNKNYCKRKIRLLNLDAIEIVKQIGSIKINRSLYNKYKKTKIQTSFPRHNQLLKY